MPRLPGLDAVLDYSRRIDGVTLESKQVRVSPDELADAHRNADPAYLETIARVRRNIMAYQEAIRHHGVIIDAVAVMTASSWAFSIASICWLGVRILGVAAGVSVELADDGQAAQAAGVDWGSPSWHLVLFRRF